MWRKRVVASAAKNPAYRRLAADREDRTTGFATREPRFVDRVAFSVSLALDPGG